MRERRRRRGRVNTGPADPTGKRTRRCSGEAEAGRGGDGVRGGVREWSGGGGVVGGSGGRRRARSGARDAPIQIGSGGKAERGEVSRRGGEAKALRVVRPRAAAVASGERRRVGGLPPIPIQIGGEGSERGGGGAGEWGSGVGVRGWGGDG